MYVYLGSKDDAAFKAAWANFTSIFPQGSPLANFSVTTYATYWDFAVQYDLEVIQPVNWLPYKPGASVGGVASVLLSRDALKTQMAAATVAGLRDCLSPAQGGRSVCIAQQLYHDITGNVGSPQPSDVSVSPGFRDAVVHLVVGGNDALMDGWYALGANSYFSESAFEIGGANGGTWQNRYWGPNYAKLLQVKKVYDPNNVFWCRHCVGDG